MGNRAVITNEDKQIGVYVHWNGGIESVLAFIDASKELGVRGPSHDPSYFFARFAQNIANFFGGTTCIGVNILSKLDTDNYDNGTYIIDKNWDIKEILYTNYPNFKKDIEAIRNGTHEYSEAYNEIKKDIINKWNLIND